MIDARDNSAARPAGSIAIVGIGPGDYEGMTIRAARVLETCDVIIGYTLYVELIKTHFPGKEMLTTPMRKEKERCILALKEAAKGREVAVVCSGDGGIYGMAGLLLEIQAASEAWEDIPVSVIPGVTAAISGAAILGAPLMGDFAVISLSDLLVPWETIEKRLRAAAESGLTICLYNPGSHKRTDHLLRACRICLESLSPQTVCGVARNIGRDGQETLLMSLEELADYPADMFSTVFIGNSRTQNLGGRMVTGRGYKL